MSTFLAEVRVMLKPSVNDPQGLSIRNALRTLGFENVSDVRAGKLISVTLEAADSEQAKEQVRAMADRLLANPVIEVFEVSLSEAGAPAT
jgi:phosphoribosylformylglycinamidine synthase subunit PurS